MPLSQGFVFMLGLIISIVILYIILLIVISVWISNYRKTSTAIAYTLNNDNFCICTNGGLCELIVDYYLPVPVFPVETSIPDWPMIHFATNLVAAVESPWTYNKINKNNISLPITVTGDIELFAESNVIGIVAHNNDTAFVAYRGTSTKKEWEKNFEFKETLFSTSSELVSSRSIPVGCGCNGGGKRGGDGVTLKKQHQRSFVSSSSDDFEVNGSVHSGFMDLYNEFKEQLINTLEKLPMKVNKLVITGHSLGAALATLTLADNKLPSRYHAKTVCYAIASPRVGDGAFALSLGVSGRLLFRLVNISDIVNNIPTAVMPRRDKPQRPYLYSHSGVGLYFQTQRESIVQNHLLPTYMAYITSQLP
jgi:hypothetical protein